MLQDILFTFLISFSLFGEARAGIPYGELNGLPIMLVFIVGLVANLLVFPIFYKAIELANKHLWKNPFYKKTALFLALRARTKTKEVIKKYGVWGRKSFLGKKYMGIVRTTFLINSKGKIHKIWSNVRVKDHAKEVVEELKKI